MTERTDPPNALAGAFGLPVRIVKSALSPIRLFPWPFLPIRDENTGRYDDEIARDQLDIVIKAMGDFGGVGVFEGNGRDRYLYRPGHALVREADRGDVQSYLASLPERYNGEGSVVERPLDDLVVLELPQRTDGGDVPETLADLDDRFGPGVVRPDHLLHVTIGGTSKLCPAIEPRIPRGRLPVPAANHDRNAGTGVRVAVVDSGWWPKAAEQHWWLASGAGGETEAVNLNDMDPYDGHGTFVAGVIKCQAPAADVSIEAVLPFGGAAYESKIVEQLKDAMDAKGNPPIISISAGTYTKDDAGLLAFDVLFAREARREGDAAALVVAAAGNDSWDRPFFPAAYEWVVGVGSLDSNNKVSWFSNRGPWVDVYALGRDHVNAYPDGTFIYREKPVKGNKATFKTGLARWSGTSFSTPLVAGRIAAGMSVSQKPSASEVYEDLKGHATPLTDPDVGDILAIL